MIEEDRVGASLLEVLNKKRLNFQQRRALRSANPVLRAFKK